MQTLSLPDWTADDFYGPVVYEWLYGQRDNKFQFQQYLSLAQVMAKRLRVVGFTRMWNEYVKAMDPRKDAVYISNTEFTDQPVQLQCGKYLCDDTGVYYTGMMGENVKVISHPLMPVKRIINVDTNEEKLEVAYTRGRTSKWRTMIVNRETLASAQKVVGLARNGIDVNSENAKEVVRYMSELESLNYDAFGVQNSTGHMGWLPDGQFAPYADGVVYDGENAEFTKIYNSFSTRGSEDVWMAAVKDIRSGNSVPARIALAASFAAPLVQIMGALPFFVHLWGTQGCGKTVGLLLAASVWGKPEVSGYIKTFAGTKVSLELHAAFCGNLPILLDELQVISDRKTFDDIIYSLCEGASKGRGAKDGGLQLQRRWSSCIITTGEMPIVQGNSGGGAAVRTIEVNYGGQPLFDDARATANLLKENYGFAGRRFIAALHEAGVIDVLKERQRKYYADLSGDIQDKQVLSASILLAADYLADKAIFHDNKYLTVADIMPYLITRDQADVNNRCYQWLIGYIGGNPRRFQVDDNAGELWGVKEDNVVYIIRSFFDRILSSEGFSPNSFLVWADRRNKILCESYDGDYKGTKRLTRRKRIGGTQLPCVALILPGDEEQQQQQMTPVRLPDVPNKDRFVEVTDEEMPF